MTEKELLYMEDAISHEQNLASLFQNFSSEIADKDLRKFITKLANKHLNLEEKLLKTMEEAYE